MKNIFIFNSFCELYLPYAFSYILSTMKLTTVYYYGHITNAYYTKTTLKLTEEKRTLYVIY